MNASELRTRALDLGPYLSRRLGGELAVTDARLAGEGMSGITMFVRLSDHRELAIRAQGDLILDSAALSLEAQFAVLEAVDGVAEVPSPSPVLLETDPAPLGAPFMITARLPGTAVVPWSAAGAAFLREAGAGPAGDECINILAAIHQVTPEQGASGSLHAEARLPANAVAGLREAIETERLAPEPVLADALCWLEHNFPHCELPALVHGDYRAGNFLFEDGHISAVLDWEFAHVGDPARDLAWLMAASNRTSADLACDMIPIDEVIDRYAAAAGRTVERSTLAFWDVFMLVQSVAGWLRTTAAWSRGELDDVRIARWSYALPRLRSLVFNALMKAS